MTPNRSTPPAPAVATPGAPITVFSTCPALYTAGVSDEYARQVADVAQWSEQAGCEGVLIYTDNGTVDPWLVAQRVLESTKRLCPLVAVQPVYMHPYAVAKMVASFAYLHGRRVYLNMVAGGFKNDLLALNDPTPHDERYARLLEYTTIVLGLLRTAGPFSFDGRYYRVTNLRLTPAVPPALQPGVFMSGSSAAGLEAAQRLGATAVQYPKPVAEYEREPPLTGGTFGIRIGVIARAHGADAWAVARARFPSDRKGELTRQLANKVSDSEWHKQLSQLAEAAPGADNPYWLVPFEHYKTNCPYLVGDYDAVAGEVARYMRVGYQSFILDIPPDPEELNHTGAVFERAKRRLAS